MLRKTIFLCLFALVLVKFVKMDTTEIIFILNIKVDQQNILSCDHTDEQIHTYTTLEGGTINFKINFTSILHRFRCTDLNNVDKEFYDVKMVKNFNETVKVSKEMDTIWKCTILTHKNTPAMNPVVTVGNDNYTAAYCYMQVHVRKIDSPLTVLVNNMAVKQVRTDLSVKDIDYTVEYEYADGDQVTVTCTTFAQVKQLTMQYHYADVLSDKFNSSSISSKLGVGVRAKLNSVHNNTHMICHLNHPTNETITRITFIMRSQFGNFIGLKIDAMTLRPKRVDYLHYYMTYNYISCQQVYMVCHIEQPIVSLTDPDLDGITCDSKRFRKNRTEISFTAASNGKIKCKANYSLNSTAAEITEIEFVPNDALEDRSPLNMDLLPNGIFMELYESNKRRVMYYEFEEELSVKISCYYFAKNGIAAYVKFNNDFDNNSGATEINKTLVLNSQHVGEVVTCYLMEEPIPGGDSSILREITVIFLQKITTTTPTALTPITERVTETTPSSPGVQDEKGGGILLLVAVGVVTIIVVIGVAVTIYKLKKRASRQGGPSESNYENFQNQSEASIPAYPVQWESNYAVPTDQRRDEETYSEPVKPEAAMYATPVPKSERRKEEKPNPTYAVLNINTKDRRNVFKNRNDPTYAEISTKLEDCYAKVLPKAQRNVHNESPYANIANESPYANTVNEPEPMYCEPSGLQSRGAHYVNVNNKYYANSPSQEYVEPTYCEPTKRK